MIVPESGIKTADVPQNAVDVSKMFYEINLPSAQLLNAVMVGNATTSTDPKWFDDAPLPIGTQLKTNYTANSGKLKLDNVDSLIKGSVLKVGDTVFMVEGVQGDEATVKVLANDAAHASGESTMFLGNSREQGSSPLASDYTKKIPRHNVTQIFDDNVVITGTQGAVSQHGNGNLIVSIESEVKAKLQRLYLMLGRALWNNPRVSAEDNDNKAIMGGLDWFITQNGQTEEGVFSYDNISAFIYDLYEGGLVNPQLWVNPADIPRYMNLYEDRVRFDQNTKLAGRPVPVTLATAHGIEVPIKLDTQCPIGNHYVIDPALINVAPLSGRQFHVTREEGSTNDNKRARLLGEYTARIFNSALMGRYTIGA